MSNLPPPLDCPLPYTLKVKGRFWYFRHVRHGTHRLRGEYGDAECMAHYQELLRRFGVVGVRTNAGKRKQAIDSADVYFIGWDGGPIKIGIATDVTRRLASLQNACPYELKLFATAPGGRGLEQTYHRRFAAFCLRGEWFERHSTIDDEIERLNRGGMRCPSRFKIAA